MSNPAIEGIEIIELIGRGAFSTVYRATEPGLGRTVAVKVVDIDAADLERRRRFERECILIGRLAAHPNVVSVFSQGATAEGRPYLVMELCPAGSMHAMLTRTGLFDPIEVLEIGVGLAGALETAHREGVLHRDLKPENILIGSDGAPKVGDFGIATLAAGATSTTTTAMTPVHAAPELFEGRPASIRSDVYSFGSTLFTLLEGRPPITLELGELASFVGRAARETRPPVGVRVPSQLAALVAELLSLDPQQRPASMAEIGGRLREIQASLGEPSSPLVVIEPTSETVQVEPHHAASTTEEPRGLGSGPGARGRDTADGIDGAARPSRRRASAVVGVIGVIGLVASAVGISAWLRRGDDSASAAESDVLAVTETRDAPEGFGDIEIDWRSPRAEGDVTTELLLAHDPSLGQGDSDALAIMSQVRLMLDPEVAATPPGQRAAIPQPPVGQPYDYPARAVMDFVNPISFATTECRGFKSSLLGLVDGRYMVFNEDTLLVTFELDTVEHAREQFVGTALQMGQEPDRCAGFDDDGWPTDRTDMRIERNDFGIERPTGIDDMVTGTTTDRALGAIVRRGTVVSYVRMPAADHPDPVAELSPIIAAVAAAMDDHVEV